jgi:hypothetical protein
MTVYDPNEVDLASFIDQGNDHWNDGPVLELYPNAVDDMNMINYSPLEANANPSTFCCPLSNFSTPHNSAFSVPQCGLYNLPPTFVLPSSPNSHIDSNLYRLLVIRVASVHPTAPEPSESFSGSAHTPLPLPASISTPIAVPTIIKSRRASIPCPSCSKICTSQERAWACFFNHIGAKPFPCNGTCGTIGW